MAQKVEGKDERPLQQFSLKNFLAVNTTNSRNALRKESFYDLTNAQPIGFSNIHSVNDISASLHNYGADTVYTDANANVAGIEYLIQASTNSKLFAFNVGSSIVTQINGAVSLAGIGTTFAQWSNTEVLLVDSTGYYGWNGSGNISAITGSGCPTSGNAIAVYQNRVWIVQGRLLYFSAPGTFSDFTTANGGGTLALIDSTLRSSVQALLAANGYLYLFGTTSVDAISDLYIPAGASPPTPNFTKLNLSALIGTDQPSSIVLYGRLVVFANRYGVWSLYGTSITSISGVDPNNAYDSAIDGTWQYVTFTQSVSGAQCITNNMLCAAFLIQQVNDPLIGSRTVLAMYQGNVAGGRWWFAQYGVGASLPTRITTAYVNNAPAVFAYIGNQLYQLFSLTTSSPAARVMTALWDFDDPITAKEVIRAGIGVSVFQNTTNGLISLTVDTPAGSLPVQLVLPGFVQWVNNFGVTVTWINNALNPVSWIGAIFGTYFSGQSHAFSKYVGMTVSTQKGVGFELQSFLMEYKLAQRWVGN